MTAIHEHVGTAVRKDGPGAAAFETVATIATDHPSPTCHQRVIKRQTCRKKLEKLEISP
jgi:hypothetical protein